MLGEKNGKKTMESKQHASKQQVNEEIRGNKIPWDKWK